MEAAERDVGFTERQSYTHHSKKPPRSGKPDAGSEDGNKKQKPGATGITIR